MNRWLGVFLAVVISFSISVQLWQLYSFVHQGARFTAADGQALCERVARLENPPGECHYLEIRK